MCCERIILMTLLAVTLTGCAGSPKSETDTSRPRVVTSVYPMEFVAARVAGADADVENLTAPGAEPHDLELSARQAADLARADAVVYISGLQAAVDRALARIAGPSVVDAASLVETLPATVEEAHGSADHDAHEDDERHSDGHEHGTVDPHLWLDPKNLIESAASLAAVLSKVDPANRDGYSARARALIADLTELDTQFRRGLATCERRTIVTAHAAFAYLAHAYDLRQIPIAGLDPSHEPTPNGVASIAAKVDADGVTTVFTERLVSPAVADTVARETGAKTAVLDPIEGLAEETRDETYLTLMRQNLEAIRAANGCS